MNNGMLFSRHTIRPWNRLMAHNPLPVTAIDAVVNIQTQEALAYRPEDRRGFMLKS